MIRELVLQLKLGRMRPAYFADKYGVDILAALPRRSSRRCARDGYLARGATPTRVALTREGLLRVDSLLPRFFLPEHTGIRYT